MDLITLFCVFDKGKHPKRIPTMRELLKVPIIPPKNKPRVTNPPREIKTLERILSE